MRRLLHLWHRRRRRGEDISPAPAATQSAAGVRIAPSRLARRGANMSPPGQAGSHRRPARPGQTAGPVQSARRELAPGGPAQPGRPKRLVNPAQPGRHQPPAESAQPRDSLLPARHAQQSGHAASQRPMPQARQAPASQPPGSRADRAVPPGAQTGRAQPRAQYGSARAAIRADSGPRAEAAVLGVPDVKVATDARAALPWYERARSSQRGPGHRHCGQLEGILRREWDAGAALPAQVVLAIDRLAELPPLIKERLVAGLDAIYVGPGGVPDLDDMSTLSGVPLPSGRATWDACAGAYGERKVIVGSRPSPTPDVMCHEIGHALDDIDGSGGCWQSDSAEFGAIYGRCLPSMVSDFHRQPGHLGRREFFADAFAAIASSQRPALVEMVGGNTRAALSVMLYFNVRYGI